MRRLVREHVSAAAVAATRPTSTDQFIVAGPGPLSVLILGGGVAVGHGTTSRRDALDGQLGQRIADATQRGVRVQNFGTHDSRLADQVAFAEMYVAEHRPEVVIWCPSYVEMTDRRPTAHWKFLLRRLASLSATGGVIALELPVPTGSGPAAIAAAPIIGRINKRLRTARATTSTLIVVAPPPVPVRALGEPLFDRDYYEALAELVLHAVPDLLLPSTPRLVAARTQL